MKTIGYGLVQIPIVTQYRACCIKRTLKGGVTSTGWQQIIACTIRIVLLSSWGMDSIDFSLPLTARKIIGVYVELFILSLQVANGIAILFGLWSDNTFLLYPSCALIPSCFLTDIIIKGSCYGELFLTHKVTVFGVFSLIEVWLRGFISMYGWIIIISYIYYKRKEWDPTKVDVELNTRSPGRVSTLGRRNSSKSPFSRNSSLSRRGRHSFLLRKSSKRSGTQAREEAKNEDKEEQLFIQTNGNSANHNVEPIYAEIAKKQPIYDRPPYAESVSQDTNSSFNNNTPRLTSESGRDGESEILLGESATMSMRRHPPPKSNPLSKTVARQDAEDSPYRLLHKKKGGFVPEVLRTPSKLEKKGSPGQPMPRFTTPHKHASFSSYSDSTTTANTVDFSSEMEIEKVERKEDDAVDGKMVTPPHSKNNSKRDRPPTLPKKPPAGTVTAQPTKIESSFMSWISPTKKKNESRTSSETTNLLMGKHKPDPVLV